MPVSRGTIMVVEDEVLLLEAITKKLHVSHFDVIGCRSGEQALDYLKSVPEMPNAIWLDFYLKDMNGLDFLKQVRANPDQKWQRIPVLVVSNSASEPKVNAMLALGASGYLLKAEHRLDDIINRIEKLIDQREPHGYD